jgi:hypothetical protein
MGAKKRKLRRQEPSEVERIARAAPKCNSPWTHATADSTQLRLDDSIAGEVMAIRRKWNRNARLLRAHGLTAKYPESTARAIAKDIRLEMKDRLTPLVKVFPRDRWIVGYKVFVRLT